MPGAGFSLECLGRDSAPGRTGRNGRRDGVGGASRVCAAYGTKVAIIVFYSETVAAPLNRVREQRV